MKNLMHRQLILLSFLCILAGCSRIQLPNYSLPPLKCISLTQFTAPFKGIAFNPRRPEVAVGCIDHVIRVFDCDTWEVRLELQGHQNIVNALAYSPDGSLLASIDEATKTNAPSSEIRLWKMPEGRPLSVLATYESSASNGASGIAFSSDGTILSWVHPTQSHNIVTLRSLVTQEEVSASAKYLGGFPPIPFMIDGNRFLLASGALWKLDTQPHLTIQRVRELPAAILDGSAMRAYERRRLMMGVESRVLVDTQSILVRHVPSGELVAHFSLPGGGVREEVIGDITSDGRYLIEPTDSGLLLLDANKPRAINWLETGSPIDVKISPDSVWVVAIDQYGSSRRVCVWRMSDVLPQQ